MKPFVISHIILKNVMFLFWRAMACRKVRKRPHPSFLSPFKVAQQSTITKHLNVCEMGRWKIYTFLCHFDKIYILVRNLCKNQAKYIHANANPIATLHQALLVRNSAFYTKCCWVAQTLAPMTDLSCLRYNVGHIYWGRRAKYC